MKSHSLQYRLPIHMVVITMHQCNAHNTHRQYVHQMRYISSDKLSSVWVELANALAYEMPQKTYTHGKEDLLVLVQSSGRIYLYNGYQKTAESQVHT